MTCREKLAIEHPDKIDPALVCGCCGCPDDYGYLKPDENICNMPTYRCSPENHPCNICWDREIPEAVTDKEMKKKENFKYVPYDEMMAKCEDTPKILDSGNRREFETGAVRDIQEGKGRCDLMPLDVVAQFMNDNILRSIYLFQCDGTVGYLFAVLADFAAHWDDGLTKGEIDIIIQRHSTMLLEVSKHFEEGAKKYGENNWQKGIPVHCYIDSAVRHYLKFLRGDTDEPHDRAFCWNIMCAIWTCKHKPELNEYKVNKSVSESIEKVKNNIDKLCDAFCKKEEE